ncbi:MAG: hypothetical protein JO097_03255 [Acidobacteriaceae bacterium]|nr:hypothetical protein [Acidobacteriaceae bacterium]MBV9765251.1 hypothetical protein [Acidobacteriaceae bacterium]
MIDSPLCVKAQISPAQLREIKARLTNCTEVLVFVTLFAFAALPCSSNTSDLLDRGYRDMYNLSFNDAHHCFQEWERIHPNDPFGPVSDAAAYLFTEFDRLKVLRSEFFIDDRVFLNGKKLKPEPQIKNHFDSDLDRSRQLAQIVLREAPDDQNALLATVLRMALQADYAALIDKRYWQAMAVTKETRVYAGQLLSKHPDCYDANLASGIENYLLSLKPAPVRWALNLTGAETNRRTGITKLRLVAEKGHYLKPYAKILLAIAALRNNDKGEAKRLISELATQFPDNDLFRNELAKLS